MRAGWLNRARAFLASMESSKTNQSFATKRAIVLLDEAAYPKARPLSEWHEDDGSVLWWKLPVEEDPYVGHPNCDTWPGYHTHWTPIVCPDTPPST